MNNYTVEVPYTYQSMLSLYYDVARFSVNAEDQDEARSIAHSKVNSELGVEEVHGTFLHEFGGET